MQTMGMILFFFFFFCFKNFLISNCLCIWIQHEKVYLNEYNKPILGSVALKIALKFSKNCQISSLFVCKNLSQHFHFALKFSAEHNTLFRGQNKPKIVKAFQAPGIRN